MLMIASRITAWIYEVFYFSVKGWSWMFSNGSMMYRQEIKSSLWYFSGFTSFIYLTKEFLVYAFVVSLYHTRPIRIPWSHSSLNTLWIQAKRSNDSIDRLIDNIICLKSLCFYCIHRFWITFHFLFAIYL